MEAVRQRLEKSKKEYGDNSFIRPPHELAEQMEDGKGREATWNMGRLPKNLGKGKTPDRIFFACEGYCRGHFLLSTEVLYNPDNEKKPYSLIFDVTTWTPIDPIQVERFRRFRYLVDMPE